MPLTYFPSLGLPSHRPLLVVNGLSTTFFPVFPSFLFTSIYIRIELLVPASSTIYIRASTPTYGARFPARVNITLTED